jgi:Flp pilus assembly protein TadG
MKQLILKTVVSLVPQSLRRLARDRRGVSAVEFALLAPLMIGLYLGLAEVTDGVSADRKVTLTASALANLTGQVETISTGDMQNILDAGSKIMFPYTKGLLKSTIACLKIDAASKATVQWSITRNGDPVYTKGDVYNFSEVNSALAVPNSWLILAEVSYDYTPTIGYTIAGTLTLAEKMFMSPRISAPTYDGQTCS